MQGNVFIIYVHARIVFGSTIHFAFRDGKFSYGTLVLQQNILDT